MLKYRILTAIVALPLVIWGVLALPAPAFAIIMGAVIALAAWEWSSFLKFNHVSLRCLYVLVVVAGLYASLYVLDIIVISVGLLIWIWSFFAVYQFNKHADGLRAAGAEYPIVRMVLGFCILVSTWAGMIVLRWHWTTYEVPWLLFAFIIVWITDTGAYFAGRVWGKQKLAVNVSPKKTWQGVWGGLVSGFITAVILSFCVDLSWLYRVYYWGLSIVVIIFSIVGDLTISVFKRQTQLKDSGKLFPGHGGILDRLDSIAPAVVIYAFGILLVLR
ncbi:MAG: phosphatidate cytidylyltransferase [Gammaproteobacteria bacterium]|nr:phosphatidate cytidylyltransferase [Gammaproteobacteria bacterium]MCH9744042.1 phosphatidate cytidylyltransferase [Gammaproteobacteria bacterium]